MKKLAYVVLQKLALMIFAICFIVSNAEARNCKKGKPCGNSCISKNDVCHKEAGSQAAEVTTPAQTTATHEANVAQAPKEVQKEAPAASTSPAKQASGSPAKQCAKGKACGNSCIAKDAVCHL